MENNFILSPLNFTGGKYKLLPQILPLFPQNIKTFFDIFCGGANVGLNVCAEKIICNDIDSKIIGIFNFFKQNDFQNLKPKIDSVISSYNLSDSTKNSYAFYNCSSSNGLGSFNKSGFLKLRNDFNLLKTTNSNYFLYLYVLIVFSFNNQIRFNSKDEFNLPVGKRDFNLKMQKKLEKFISVSKQIEFSNKSFEQFKIDDFKENDFVYCDPPYLITCATYNEKNAWTEIEEKKLLEYLDSLNEKNIKFALSNVLESNGKSNDILKEWLKNHSNYKCHHLSFSYKNSNYQKKQISNITDEVLITNY